MNTCPVLVGRQKELDALVADVARGGVTLVTGDPGVGKSRLMRALAEIAASDGRLVLWGRPEILADPGPFSVIADLLEDCRAIEGLREEASELLISIDSREAIPPRQLAARLRGMVGVVTPRPLIVLEDLQDADEMSLAVLGHLGRAAPDDGIRVIATHRPDPSAGLDRLLEVFRRDRLAATVELNPLSRDEVAEVLRAMWGREPSADEVAEVTQLAEGNPLFVEELAASPGGIPESVTRAVTARISALSAEARSVVEAASLVTGAIDPDLLASVLQIDDHGLGLHLVAAIRAGLLIDREGRLAFRHALIREAVAAGMVSLERRRISLSLAAAIEERSGTEVASHAATLARLYTAAGLNDKAARYFLMAGTAALEVAALEEARAHFRAAGVSTDARLSIEAREGLCLVAYRINKRDPSDWERVAEEYQALGDSAAAARCLRHLAEVESSVHGDDAGWLIYERARALLDEEREPAELAEVLIWSGGRKIGGPEHAIARQRLESGLALARKCNRHDLAAQALGYLGRDAGYNGKFEEAISLLRRASEEAVSSGDGAAAVRTHLLRAQTAEEAGLYRDALAALDEASDWARRAMGAGTVAMVETQRAYLLHLMGCVREAEAVAVRQAASPAALDVVAFVRFGAILERDGDPDARRYLAGWWDALGGEDHRRGCLGDPAAVLEYAPRSLPACLADFLVAEISADDSVEWWQGVIERFAAYYSAAAFTTRLDVGWALTVAALRTGLVDVGERVLAEAETLIAHVPSPRHHAKHSQLRGMVDHRRSLPSATQHLRTAMDGFLRIVNPVEAARTAALGLSIDENFADRGLLDSMLAAAERVDALVARSKLEAAMRSRGLRPRSGRPRGRPRAAPGELSAREQEVAVLVAAGASNLEIARRLVLSDRTVEDHIARAQRRLGVQGRAGLAAWAAKRGLV